MICPRLLLCVSSFLLAFTPANAQDGYIGYSLNQRGDEESVIYETADTAAAGGVNSSYPAPDVFLNASVHVGEINIEVNNLTAKVNLDAQVLNLLQFNAGVDASINKVQLLIQNVTAKVLLEARLGNVVTMIGDVLDSLDLNPILVELSNGLGNIVNSTVGLLDDVTDTTLEKRSFMLDNNILYSINDYSGQTHTNRVLAQSGDIVDQFLNNDGELTNQKTVGSYLKDMTFTGSNQTIVKDGQVVQELEYMYAPFPGLQVVSAVYINKQGTIIGTRVLSEVSGGGTSTIQADD